MKQILFSALLLIAFAKSSFAQFSEFRNGLDSSQLKMFEPGNSGMQISGRISFFYGYRALKPDITDMKHNGIFPKDCDLDFLGKTKQDFVYEIHLSPLDIVEAAAVGNTANLSTQNNTFSSPNSQNPGFKAAYLAYEGKKLPFSVKIGYDKLPYSQGSMSDNYNSPFWSHPILVGGDLFSRRDMGLTVYRSLWNQKINIYGGMYSGVGENFFEYGYDASARPEYVGRIDVSYPARMKYTNIDEAMTPIPVFRLGINGRYTNKTQPAGNSLLTDLPEALGAYNIRMVNGKKTVYGADFIAKYKGISFLFEADYIHASPADPSDPLFEATPASFNKGVVNAGGIYSGLNYNWEKIHSAFSVAYENVNGNDLAAGNEEWLYAAYAYKVKGFRSVLKIEYYKPLKEDTNSDPLKYTDEIRVGYQIVF